MWCLLGTALPLPYKYFDDDLRAQIPGLLSKVLLEVALVQHGVF